MNTDSNPGHHSHSRRTILRGSAGVALQLGLGLGLSSHLRAQAPVEQLRILCSGPAGSIPDIVARRIAEQLTPAYARGALVDNRPGAAGQIAVNALKTAPADGSTVLLAQGAIATVYPYLYAKLAYDPIADLQPVSLAAEMTLGVAVGPAVPESVTTTRELVDWMTPIPNWPMPRRPVPARCPICWKPCCFVRLVLPGNMWFMQVGRRR